ncbi:FAD-binding protein [Flavobacteriales bacterium]|nr:FAD-binding protein [Flavobacteriales bacterium]
MTPAELHEEMKAQGLAVEWSRLQNLALSGMPLDSLEGPIQRMNAGDGLTEKNRDALRVELSLAWDALMESAEREMAPPDWVVGLPEFEGEVVFSGERLEMAAWDFGKVRRRRPAVVLRPAGTNDVALAVKFCRANGIVLSPRGFAHSAGAQMQARGGIVLDMKSMCSVCSLSDDHIEVEAGAGWDLVLETAMQRGRTPPIVTDWLKVSVGGTISMGGFGFMSFWRGAQMDHLLELEVVTGAGEVVRCSSVAHRDLFNAVRGTHGAFGIITKAIIPLEPAPEKVRLVQACYGSLKSMIKDVEHSTRHRMTDLIHAFAAEKSKASIVTKMNSTEAMPMADSDVKRALDEVPGNWVYNLEMVDFVGGPHDGGRGRIDRSGLGCEPGLSHEWEMDWREFCFRVPPLVLEEQFRGAAPHPELCSWVPLDGKGLELLDSEFSRLHPSQDIGGGPVLFFPLKTDLLSAPFFRLPEAEYCLFWGLLRRAEPATPERISELMADNEAVYRRVRRVGGERYLPDTPPETPEFWRSHFGPLWSDLVASRKRWDPDGVFASSFGAFLVPESDMS